MIIDDFAGFAGQHCETTATGALLTHAGLTLTEPMLFGLGEGLAYGIFVFKAAPAPFIAGRSKPEAVTRSLASNLDIDVDFRTTRSAKRAWANVADFVDGGQPVAAKLDMHFLDYFDTDAHFAGHYVAVYGYDDHDVHLVDTIATGQRVSTSREHFEAGRLWKGPMASNALTWTIAPVQQSIDWKRVLRRAIRTTATSYLHPPISNFGAKGIRKTAELVVGWLDTIADPAVELPQMADLMESGGTGGGLFRTMYADFLDEANVLLEEDSIGAATRLYRQASGRWTGVARFLAEAPDDGSTRLRQAAAALLEIADVEERAAQLLLDVAPDV